MDPKCSAQDVVRCHLCETPLPPLHCDTCHLDLCKACVGKHVLDDSRDHKMVSFKQRGTTPIYPNCPNHDKKQCEFYCKECNVFVCSNCILTNSHKGHTLLHSLDVTESKLKDVENDVNELQNSIYPKYEKIVLELKEEKNDVEIYYGELTTDVIQRGEELHQEINILVSKNKTEIIEMKTKHLAVLKKQEDEIANTVSEITQNIAELKKLLDSKNVCLVTENKSKNAQFRKMPPKQKVSLPNFTPLKINKGRLTEQFGSLSTISFTEEERGIIMSTQKVESSPPNSKARENEDFGDRRTLPRDDRWKFHRDWDGFSNRAPTREERDRDRGGGWKERWGGGGGGEERRGGDSWRDRRKKEVGDKREGGAWRGVRTGGDSRRERTGEKEGWSRRDDRGPAREDRGPVRGVFIRSEGPPPSREGGRSWRDKQPEKGAVRKPEGEEDYGWTTVRY